jgi:hypothetical protein
MTETIFEEVEERLRNMPKQPLTREDHGPCMNCSFANDQLIDFYQWLFLKIDERTYRRLDRVVMLRVGITHYEHFLPRYGMVGPDFLDTEKNAFWCFKVEEFLEALREVLENEDQKEASTVH